MERVYKERGFGYNVADKAGLAGHRMVIYGRERLARIRPFHGLYYNQRVVGDISRVVAPPYDVIDEAKKLNLQKRSPYNIVRLILPQDPGDKDFWNTSAAVYRAWKRGDVLVRDEAPCIYLHQQTFDAPQGRVTRTGIICALRCSEFGSGGVLPHEMTFSRTRSERLYLLRCCRANFSQVFMVYRDGEEEILPLIEEAVSREPFMGFTDDEGVEHLLWRMEDPEVTAHIARAVEEKEIIIADGHHRYETALIYSGEDPSVADPGHPRKYVSVTLVRSQDPGLVILPVHRVLKTLPEGSGDIEDRLREYFDVEAVPQGVTERRGPLTAHLPETGPAAFLMATRDKVLRLTLNRRVNPDKAIAGGQSSRWKRLDISILHALVLRGALGLDTEVLAENGELYFTPWESLDDLCSGRADVAFLIRPTRMEEIWEIARGGERMPHKSSYFYPKLPSGLIIYDHEVGFS